MGNDWQSNYNQNQQQQHNFRIESQLNNIQSQLALQNSNRGNQRGSSQPLSPFAKWLSIGLPVLILFFIDIFTSGGPRDNDTTVAFRTIYLSYCVFGLPILVLRKIFDPNTRSKMATPLFALGYLLLLAIAFVTRSYFISPIALLVFLIQHRRTIKNIRSDIAIETKNKDSEIECQKKRNEEKARKDNAADLARNAEEMAKQFWRQFSRTLTTEKAHQLAVQEILLKRHIPYCIGDNAVQYVDKEIKDSVVNLLWVGLKLGKVELKGSAQDFNDKELLSYSQGLSANYFRKDPMLTGSQPLEENAKTIKCDHLDDVQDPRLPTEIKKKTRNAQSTQTASAQLKLIGQRPAIDELDKIIAIAKVNAARQVEGLSKLDINLHSVFSGSPGTGKTSFARYYANKIKELGLLKKGHVTEVSRGDLVAAYMGQTAIKTENVVKSALGGVLFIDEAYSLKSSKDDSYGQEAVDTLLKLIEDHKSDLVVIFAGYESQMREFLSSNPGFKSRIPNWIKFSDYANNELQDIFLTMCKERDLSLSAEDLPLIMEKIVREKKGRDFGNARTVRNVLEQIISKQTLRLSKDTVALKKFDYQTILRSDILDALSPQENASGTPARSRNSFESNKAESVRQDTRRNLDQMIGLKNAKAQIEELIAFLEVTKLRKGKVDLKSVNIHMVFSGKPGTGKTTVARLVGEIFRQMGILPSGHVVEVDRSALVAGFAGQTAIKTKEVIESAFGGVLFIDEAYSLHQSSSDSFGDECISTLVKYMEDYRDKFVLVVAGYPEQMKDFLSLNAGLKSRFSKTIDFEDYSNRELVTILQGFLSAEGLKISPEALNAVESIFDEKRASPSFANARTARQIFEDIMKAQSLRIFKGRLENHANQDLDLITAEDIEAIGMKKVA